MTKEAKTEKTVTEFKVQPRPAQVNAGKFTLQQSGYVYDNHVYRAEEGMELDTMLAPSFWSHVAGRLKPLDRIEIVPDGGKYYAELMVLVTDAKTARVKTLRYEVLEEVSPEDAESDSHMIKWRGPAAKFGVVRKDDGAVLKDGFPTKEDAAAYMREHLKAFAA